MTDRQRSRTAHPLLCAALAWAVAGPVQAAETVIRVGDGTVRPAKLAPGSYRYLRYTVKDGRRSAIDIWNRTVAFEMKEGHRQLHITQRWDEVDPTRSGAAALEQDSWFDAATFRPITHIRRVTKADGTVTQAGYRFLPDRATGMTDLADNIRQDFSLAYAEPPFNFENDMELIQTLPLARGFEANLPFYDAGIDKQADRYTFKVAGSGQITSWNGRAVDCWLITADYNSGSVKSRFWFAKTSQLLIREETQLPGGAVQIKTLLPPESSDAVGITGGQ